MKNETIDSAQATPPTKRKGWFARELLLFIIFVCFFTIVISIINPAILNYSGYCKAHERYLTNEEFLVSALASGYAKTGINSLEFPIEEFLKNNPKCCSLKRGVVKPDGFLDLISGALYATAYVQFPLVNARAHDGSKKWASDYYFEAWLVLNACGEVKHFFSMPVKKSETRFRNSN